MPTYPLNMDAETVEIIQEASIGFIENLGRAAHKIIEADPEITLTGTPQEVTDRIVTTLVALFVWKFLDFEANEDPVERRKRIVTFNDALIAGDEGMLEPTAEEEPHHA